MRLDSFISKALNLSRSDAVNIIKKGNVIINNIKILKKDYHVDVNNDVVEVNDKVINYQEFIYIMLNKPSGVVSAVRDELDKTVIDLIDQNVMHYKDLFPLGRLDKDTTGLLIITNNGALCHKVASPNHNIFKKYYVKTINKIQKKDKELFCNGLEIKDGKDTLFLTKPAKMDIISENECYVYITEGKFHQIKRMFEKLNNKVEYLKRVSYGELSLDDSLKEGEYRFLSKEEINYLLTI